MPQIRILSIFFSPFLMVRACSSNPGFPINANIACREFLNIDMGHGQLHQTDIRQNGKAPYFISVPNA